MCEDVLGNAAYEHMSTGIPVQSSNACELCEADM